MDALKLSEELKEQDWKTLDISLQLSELQSEVDAVITFDDNLDDNVIDDGIVN